MAPMLDGMIVSDARNIQMEIPNSLLAASLGRTTVVANTEAHFITVQSFIVSQSALSLLPLGKENTRRIDIHDLVLAT
jgi:hypothetical protein